MNRQNQSQPINYSKDDLIEKICGTSYRREEKINIFLNGNGKKCRTCHKLKINKKLSPLNFSSQHRRYICICDIREPNSAVHDESSNNDPNNDDIQSSQINDNDMDIDDLENEELNLSEQNSHDHLNQRSQSSQGNEGGDKSNGNEGSNHDISSREILAHQINQRNKIYNNNDGEDGSSSHHGSNGHGNNGGDGHEQINNEDNSYVTKREFIREIRRIDSSINGINNRLDNMNRNIQLLLQNQNHN